MDLRGKRSQTMAWLLGAAALLAGCTAPAPDDGPGPGAPGTSVQASAPLFGPGVFIASNDVYGFTGEPAVAVGPDGTVLVAAPFITLTDFAVGGLATDPGQGQLWRSLDRGATFTLLNDADGDLTDGPDSMSDVDVVFGLDRTMHVVQGGGPGTILRSDDGGDTWTTTGALDDRGRDMDRPWIRAQGTEVAVAYAVVEGNPRTLAVRSSHDGGITWDPAEDLAESAFLVGGPSWSPDGALWIPYLMEDGTLRVVHGTSGNWTDDATGAVLPPYAGTLPTLSPSPSVVFPVLAIDAAGTVYLAWSEYTGTGTRIGLLRSSGEGWSAPWFLDDGGNAVLPWLVAGSAGRIALVDLWGDGGDPNVGTRAWSLRVRTAFHADTGDLSPEAFTMSLVTPDPVHQGSVCPNGTACAGYVTPFVGDRSLLDTIGAALTPDGDLVVSWTETHQESGRNPEIRFARQTGGTSLLA